MLLIRIHLKPIQNIALVHQVSDKISPYSNTNEI